MSLSIHPNVTKLILLGEHFRVLDWPMQGPKLNLIESFVWSLKALDNSCLRDLENFDSLIDPLHLYL